ncbi:hypothetical protein Cadr_000005548 [Camelus dromedarius]|uniref:Uncharacterized protein n=1 Tax=Camelus dromedarius TaxID=9838 RepID=A0A5N4E4G2_CAMDR|nr:hypothetical protein Cadr_000005548 [Camelus dromedarius]
MPKSLTPVLYPDNVQSPDTWRFMPGPRYERGLEKWALNPGSPVSSRVLSPLVRTTRAPFLTPIFSPPAITVRGEERCDWGRTSGAPFPPETRRLSRSDCGPGVGRACFQPDRVPRRSRAPRLRTQPDVRTVPSRFLGSEMRGYRARASSRCVRRISGTRVVGPASILPNCPERGRYDLSSFAFPTSPPPDCVSWGKGIPERKAQRGYQFFTLAVPFLVWDFAVLTGCGRLGRGPVVRILCPVQSLWESSRPGEWARGSGAEEATKRERLSIKRQKPFVCPLPGDDCVHCFHLTLTWWCFV